MTILNLGHDDTDEENSSPHNVDLDLDVVMRSNLLLQAASGGGKSWALRRIAELACKHVPVGIIDPEGEFASLREKFPFILIGPGGETPADPRSAAMVARRVLELGVPFVADIFELSPHLRHEWVRNFFDAFIDAPKKLWRPFLIMLDEAHIYAPEGGHGRSKNTSVALNAVADMASRGRKRGYGFICATQRLGKFHKDVAAELKNVLIGQAMLDIDRERSAEALGVRRVKAERAAFDKRIKGLAPGTFYALGRAFRVPARWGSHPIDESVLTVFGPVQTTHPEPGKRRKLEPPPPRSEVKKLLPQLKDLPAEAEKEAQTVAELKEELRKVRGELGRVLDGVTVEKEVERVEVPFFPEKLAAAIRHLLSVVVEGDETVRAELKTLRAFAEDLVKQLDSAHAAVVTEGTRALPPVHRRQPPVHGRQVAEVGAWKAGVLGPGMGKGERVVLAAVAAHSSPGVAVCTTQQITVLTGYKRSSRDTYLYKLRQAGYVERDDRGGGYVATAAGIKALGRDFKPLPTGADLRDHYMQTLPEGERRILEIVCKSHARGGIRRNDLDSITGYKRSSRDTYIHKLKARQLVRTEGGMVVASEHLF